MKRIYLILALAGSLCLSLTLAEKDTWTSLFNGKDLSGWDTYLGPDLDDNGKPLTETPLGLNNDPRKVFTVVKENGENVIRVSGENWGAITTKQEYEKYHLQLQFKWGKLLWGQKKAGNKKDSGLLYHSVGKFGADYMAWMRGQEFQVEEGNCGDYWGCAGGAADIPVTKRSIKEYIFTLRGLYYPSVRKASMGGIVLNRQVMKSHLANGILLICIATAIPASMYLMAKLPWYCITIVKLIKEI